ncbi:MAG: hypothetical protein LLG04_10115 [Parachlamydia sp.]|nr:hypothetical protein [Parachlamydia sp.]
MPKAQQTLSCKPIEVPSSHATILKRNTTNGSCQGSASQGNGKCDQVTFITQADFQGAGKNGIIIDQPGKYRLCESITFAPTKRNVQAITITASDVVLDLGLFTIRQDNAKKGVYGIAVARDVHNVKITGVDGVAQIRDFSLAGIRILGRTDQITVQNVTITQTTPGVLTNDDLPEACVDVGCSYLPGAIYVGEGDPSGIAFLGTDKNNHVTNLVLDHVEAKRYPIGGQIIMTFGMLLTHCNFVENTNQGLTIGSTYPVPGDEPFTFEFPVAADGIVTNCHFDRMLGDNINIVNPLDAPYYNLMSAFILDEIQNFVVTNCTVNDNQDTTDMLIAVHDGCHNVVWENCTVDRNVSLEGFCDALHFSGSLPFSFGFCVGIGDQPLNQDFNIVVNNCTASDNQGAFAFTNGTVFAYVAGARVADCNASGNITIDEAGTGSGITVEGDIPDGQSNAFTFLRCTAERNQYTGTAAIGTGFLVRSNTANVIYRDCVANGNGLSNDNLAMSAAGFAINTQGIEESPFTTLTQNITYDNCIANGNGTAEQTTAASGGIFLRAITTRPPVVNVLIQDCTLCFNRNGIHATDDIAGVVIKRNQADLNLLVGFDLAAIASPKLVTKNIAYNNLVANYTGVPAANIVNATSTNLPDGTAVGFKNISIVP